MKNKIALIICLTVYILTVFLILSGDPILTYYFISSIQMPWGTVITWALLISLPLAFYLGSNRLRQPENTVEKVFSWVLVAILIISILYGFISRLLALNWSFNFSDKAPGFFGSPQASEWFWALNYGLAGAPLVFLVLWWGYLVIRYFRSGKEVN